MKILFMASILAITSCSTARKIVITNNIKAVISKEGFLNCFEEGLSTNGKPLWCETSAVLYDGTRILFANDKEMPDNRSSVFYWMFKNGFADTTLQPHYINNYLVKKSVKFEDFAITPDGKYVFLTTAFDRAKPGSKVWDGYNSLLFWPVGQEDTPQVISKNNIDSTSISFREDIAKALTTDNFPNGMPYFKIEGIAVDEKKMYLGIREEGEKFDQFNYKVKILSVDYSVKDEKVKLGNIFKLAADIDIKKIDSSLLSKQGLSSIEFDPTRRCFFILTSYENGDELGGYLWIATPEQLQKNTMSLVKQQNGMPLRFGHKPEDMGLIDKNTLIIIHDDDRVKTKVGNQVRNAHQAAYSIVRLME